jgi:ketol-acid reductoisomerase
LPFIGYGNQGSAQALNMRDSGVMDIIVGSRDDESAAQARADNFQVVPIQKGSCQCRYYLSAPAG